MKKKRTYKYNSGGNTRPSNRKAKRFNKRSARKNKRSDGFSPERSRKAKDKVANAIGAIGAAAIAVKGLQDIKKLKDLR